MKRMRFVFISLLFLSLLFAGSFSALAGSDFRCGGRIISVGNTRDYVLDKYGEPTSIEERTEGLAGEFRH